MMRKSQLRTLEALRVMNDEVMKDRGLMERFIAHEEKTLRALDAQQAEEDRVDLLEFDERKARRANLFTQMRDNVRAKIDICNEQMVRLADGDMPSEPPAPVPLFENDPPDETETTRPTPLHIVNGNG